MRGDHPAGKQIFMQSEMRTGLFSAYEERPLSIPETEVVAIAVLGMTGSGKSTFISSLADQDVQVGHSLLSGTENVAAYSFQISEYKTVVLVDTPGFDDTSRSDAELLQEITSFLATLYTNDIRLVGIIYLHSILNIRMSGSAVRSLKLLQKICGSQAISSVVLATTMWGKLEKCDGAEQTALERQEELCNSHFWGDMIAAGCMVRSHDGSERSGWSIVSLLVSNDADVVLDVVHELVHQGKSLNQTAAGIYVQEDLAETRRQLDSDMVDLLNEIDTVLKQGDEQNLRALTAERLKVRERIRQQVRDCQGLRVTSQQLMCRKQHDVQELKRIHGSEQCMHRSTYTTTSGRSLQVATREKTRAGEQNMPEDFARQKSQQHNKTITKLTQIRVTGKEHDYMLQGSHENLGAEQYLERDSQARSYLNMFAAFFRCHRRRSRWPTQ